jgi:hypothetical protein
MIVYACFQATIASHPPLKLYRHLFSLTPELVAMVAIFSIARKPRLPGISDVQIRFDGPI